ncbi:hypothetical protein BH20ACT11_BH20ACT11_05810 [soil metagenome]
MCALHSVVSETLEDAETSMSSTVETLERELGEAQTERGARERAVARAENAHDAACSVRDEAWSEGASTDPEVERLTSLVYERRRELYEAIDSLKAAEGRERRIKSRLMYVLPAERRRYLSGEVDEEFSLFLDALRRSCVSDPSEVRVSVVAEAPGELDLGGDATWRALERLYSGTARRWVEIHTAENSALSEGIGVMARQVAYYAGGHVPRVFIGAQERSIESVQRRPPDEWGEHRSLEGFEGDEGRLALSRITVRRYLDEGSVGRLAKQPEILIQMAEVARLYQTMNLTGDEIRWRLEQLIPLRLETLSNVHRLTGERLRFSFYEISRAARLLDGHFPDAVVAAQALSHAVDKALESDVPLVDVAYLSVVSGE